MFLDKNTFIVGMNSDSSVCPGTKDDSGPVTVDTPAVNQDTKTGKYVHVYTYLPRIQSSYSTFG